MPKPTRLTYWKHPALPSRENSGWIKLLVLRDAKAKWHMAVGSLEKGSCRTVHVESTPVECGHGPGPSDSFLAEKTRQKLMGCHFQDSVTEPLRLPCCSPFLASSHFAHSKERQLPCCELKGGTWQGTERDHWPIARGEMEPDSLPGKD